MRAVLIAVCAVFALIYLRGLFAVCRKKYNNNSGTVSLPKYVGICGVVCGGILLVPVIAMLADYDGPGMIIAFECFHLIGIALVFGYINCRITYDEFTFTAKNFFGIKRTYKFSDVTKIYGSDRDVKLIVDGHAVRVDEIALGRDEFLKRVRQNYIPKGSNPKKRKDIFNGNVENPGEFIFIYILIAIVIIASGIFVIRSVSGADLSPEAFDEVRVSSYNEKSNGVLVLYSDDDIVYKIFDYKKVISDPDDFLGKCGGNYVFRIGYIVMGKDENTYRRALSVSRINNEDYLTLEAVREQDKSERKKEGLIMGSFFGFFAVVWTVYVIMSIRVGRHPEKYSKKFIGLFFKPGYVKTQQNHSGKKRKK